MPRDIFKGPEDIDILEGALADGWTVASEPMSSVVTFHFPLPLVCDERQVSLEVSRDLYAQDYEGLGNVGFDRKRNEELGGYTTYLAINAQWPISTELILYLDKVSEKVINN